MASDAELAALLAELEKQPADLDRAWRYWRALGDYEGCDIRSGNYVVQAFRAAAPPRWQARPAQPRSPVPTSNCTPVVGKDHEGITWIGNCGWPSCAP
jgi:hypothetical protein